MFYEKEVGDMSIWHILGIEPTTDKDELKKAYRKKLSITNPEDNQEGFIALRRAYEEALAQAERSISFFDRVDSKHGDSNTKEDEADIEIENKDDTKTVDELLLDRLSNIYNSFSARINVDSWVELFQEQEFFSIDKSEHSFNILLRFLMDKFFLPKDVWKVICDTFNVEQRRNELYEIFPYRFIEYIITKSKCDDILDYEMFEDEQGENIDAYFNKFKRLDDSIKRYDLEGQEELINEIEELQVKHPYFEIMLIKHRIQQMNMEDEDSELTEEKINTYNSMLETVKKIVELYPNDSFSAMVCGDICMLLKNFEEAGNFYEKALQITPDGYVIKAKLAGQKCELSEYKEAKELFMDLLKINGYDNQVRSALINVNEKLIEEYNAKKENNQEITSKDKLDVSWCYYQNFRYDEAIKLLNTFFPEKEYACEYNNIKGRVFLALKEYDRAIERFLKWKSIIEDLARSPRRKEEKDKIKRYGYVNFLIADCYMRLEDYDKAREYMEVALSREYEEKYIAYEGKCQLEYKSGNYNECLKACNTLINAKGYNYVAYFYRAKAYYKLNVFEECEKAAIEAINIYPLFVEPYSLLIEIYIKTNKKDKAQNVIQQYNQYNKDSDTLVYYRAKLLNQMGENKEALSILNKAISKLDIHKSDLKEETMLHNLKADILYECGEKDRALTMYKEVILLNPKHTSAYGRIAYIYEENKNYKLALEHIKKQLQYSANTLACFKSGKYNYILKNYNEAAKDFIECINHDRSEEFLTECCTFLIRIFEQYEQIKDTLKYAELGMKKARKADDREYFHREYARLYQCLGDFNTSLQVYKEHIEEYGLKSDIICQYGMLLYRMGNEIEFVTFLDNCINNMPHDDYIQKAMGLLCRYYGERGDLVKSNEYFQKAIEKVPNDCEICAVMGKVYLKNNKGDMAKKYFKMAMEYDTNEWHNYIVDLIEAIEASKLINSWNNQRKLVMSKGLNLSNQSDVVKLAKYNSMCAKYKEGIIALDSRYKYSKCKDCIYGKCYRALLEYGVIYECGGDMLRFQNGSREKIEKYYKLALEYYEEALLLYGVDAVYEKRLNKLRKKLKAVGRKWL